jgi:plasmid stabilization system protein ParE
MTFGLRVTPAADADADEIAAYIGHDSVEQAIRFYDALSEAYKIILEAPNRWPLYGLAHLRLKGIRKRGLPGFPNHLIFYRIDADRVESFASFMALATFPMPCENGSQLHEWAYEARCSAGRGVRLPARENPHLSSLGASPCDKKSHVLRRLRCKV